MTTIKQSDYSGQPYRARAKYKHSAMVGSYTKINGCYDKWGLCFGVTSDSDPSDPVYIIKGTGNDCIDKYGSYVEFKWRA